MKGVGEGVAFAGLCIALAWMSVEDKNPSVWLWVLVGVWAVGSNWGNKEVQDEANTTKAKGAKEA